MSASLDIIAEIAVRLPRWHLAAGCRGEDLAIFFVDRGGDYSAARKICALCPVLSECLDYAITEDLNMGIFAGLSPNDRRQVAQGRAEVALKACEGCGDLFVTINALADFCGLSCRQRAAYAVV